MAYSLIECPFQLQHRIATFVNDVGGDILAIPIRHVDMLRGY
ncbi:hypothetical protein [Allochromatium vinosum]|nr:hypothetical protein [Allochromatium vinosum]